MCSSFPRYFPLPKITLGLKFSFHKNQLELLDQTVLNHPSLLSFRLHFCTFNTSLLRSAGSVILKSILVPLGSMPPVYKQMMIPFLFKITCTTIYSSGFILNEQFPSCLLPLFQSETWGKAFHCDHHNHREQYITLGVFAISSSDSTCCEITDI